MYLADPLRHRLIFCIFLPVLDLFVVHRSYRVLRDLVTVQARADVVFKETGANSTLNLQAWFNFPTGISVIVSTHFKIKSGTIILVSIIDIGCPRTCHLGAC